ncbi:hypothetical protein Asulf_00919 [Archaeoglobus sulfaticallidus PM70-1]|uniref:Uncharacterized protein n=1 Tax=Archaeoglobus sulfaticallidus PM70-1 TaxID=387631 RepID=N0BBE8_9EURY|nr:hypothetical protein [Archaeoglobus sulfaticallidus]AGK60924.1 hypothetical protein Asulf_00919 [Archaeoglobus sulfaticallidus PM70-1]
MAKKKRKFDARKKEGKDVKDRDVKDSKPEAELVLTPKHELAKTFIPLFFGLIAGIISYLITGDVRSRDPISIVVLVIFIYINKFIMPKFDITLQSKDWVGFAFLTFATWYISWTLLLNI